MNRLRRQRWPLVAAMFAVVAHLIMMMMAPASAQAAPGTLLHALSIVCTPDGARSLDDGDDAAPGRAPVDHCVLCVGLGTPLNPAARAAEIAPRDGTLVALPHSLDPALAATLYQRPASRAPPSLPADRL